MSLSIAIKKSFNDLGTIGIVSRAYDSKNDHFSKDFTTMP
jgi:hypothetical protein